MENGQVTVDYIRTLNIDEPLARIQSNGTVRFYQQDALGSVIDLTDETGAIKTTYSYDPFGNTTVSGEISDNPFQYTGRENDGTGLYYYRFRYYSPEFQRFISEDPIRFGGGINFFAYVKNNPIMSIDPFGLACIKIWSTVTGWLKEITSIQWELRDMTEIIPGLTYICTWDKHERGWMTKYIEDYYLCIDCNNCNCNFYFKTENRTEFNKYDDIIFTTYNMARLSYPVGGYSLGFWQCFEPD